MHTYDNYFVSGPKFTNFSSNVGWLWFDHVLFRFSSCRSIQEIYAIKVQSGQKSRRILDVFCPPKFCWGGRAFQKLHAHYYAYLPARCMEVS